MESDHWAYRERTSWAPWMSAILWGACIVAAFPILTGWQTTGPFAQRVLIAVGVLLVPVVVDVLFGGTTMLVGRSGIRVFLGRVPLLSKRIAYAEVRALESVRYGPIKDFGGWGLRGSSAKQAWTARGDQAVVFHLLDGRDIYVGSDNPHRLEERIRMVAGGRLGTQE